MIVPSPGRYLAVAHSSIHEGRLLVILLFLRTNQTAVVLRLRNRMCGLSFHTRVLYRLVCRQPSKSHRATRPQPFLRRTADKPWVRSAKVPGASARGGTRATRCAGGTSPNDPGGRVAGSRPSAMQRVRVFDAMD